MHLSKVQIVKFRRQANNINAQRVVEIEGYGETQEAAQSLTPLKSVMSSRGTTGSASPASAAVLPLGNADSSALLTMRAVHGRRSETGDRSGSAAEDSKSDNGSIVEAEIDDEFGEPCELKMTYDF